MPLPPISCIALPRYSINARCSSYFLSPLDQSGSRFWSMNTTISNSNLAGYECFPRRNFFMVIVPSSSPSLEKYGATRPEEGRIGLSAVDCLAPWCWYIIQAEKSSYFPKVITCVSFKVLAASSKYALINCDLIQPSWEHLSSKISKTSFGKRMLIVVVSLFFIMSSLCSKYHIYTTFEHKVNP